MRLAGWVAAAIVGAACGRTPVWLGERERGPVTCDDVLGEEAELTPQEYSSAHPGCRGLPLDASPFGCGPVGACAPVAGCNPRQGTEDPWVCCSDDPATPGGALPAYAGRGIQGAEPIFSGDANGRGTSGICVRVDATLDGLREPNARGCPVPCNPTWTASDVAEVCGPGRVCCQTRALDPKDCVVDPQTGLWRPVRGTDVGEPYPDGRVITDWAPGMHATHEDPSGVGCSEYAGGDEDSAIFDDCVAQLTVADQRGFCTERETCEDCRTDLGFADACEALNR